ncbi:lytic polysaccharide monooxygenase [Streptomyces sp. C10-9-1]|uniref:lytic polysaccharide monooxygenase n=1 Tax=Streptomyces sp. C10-9-1 TaxID=1859285 RepID=UPI0021121291|nr:lytic polysaccharide monooxygenase [Streptomyces sp. C10-9-1]MCQ6553365.1 lytic polysaccharide monooxygenase [Streptomyces sp. C10-9-1]
MNQHRAPALAVSAALAVPFLLLAPAAAPAAAHGAPTDPVSRAAACGAGSAELRATDACRAAAAASAGGSLGPWDDLRVAGVAGRDRSLIPDGRLCSAGLGRYRGLDLARADWPATLLRQGAAVTMTYRATIAHRGTFTVYATRQGRDPAAPLTWGALSTRPLATVTDPPLRDGRYRIRFRLPENLTGRHVLYTVWRNTDTPDTYYSCSDVVLTPGSGAPSTLPVPSGGGEGEDVQDPPEAQPPAHEPPSPAAPDGATGEPGGAEPSAGAGAGAPAGPPQAGALPAPPRTAPTALERLRDDKAVGILAGGVAGVLALASLCGAVLLRRRAV